MPICLQMENGEKLFWDNVKYNSALSKREAKCRYSVGRLVQNVTPLEVLEELKKYGVNITQRTLQRYEKAGLIPIPRRGSAGRGKGKFTDYPLETVAETVVAYRFINDKKKPVEKIAETRKTAQNKLICNKNWSVFWDVVMWKVSVAILKHGFDIPPEGWYINDDSSYSDSERLKEINLNFVRCGEVRNNSCPENFSLSEYICKKYNLKEDDDFPDDIDCTCPYENICEEKGKNYTSIVSIFANDDKSMKFKIRERPRGTNLWKVIIEEQL